MIKKILAPIAFSKFAKGIITYAAELAESTGAELLIVNVINQRNLDAVNKITSYGYKVDSDHYLETIKKERIEELENMIKDLTLADDKVTYHFSIGNPADELLELVIDQNIDMVVMGVKNNDFSHIFTGSVAEKIFRKCPVTVVSYRDNEISKRLRKNIIKHRRKME